MSLIAAILVPDDQQNILAYRTNRATLCNAALPIVKVFIHGALSAQQKDYLMSKILLEKGDEWVRIISPMDTNFADFIFDFNIIDAASKLSSEDRTVYSKYYAGDTQVPNPSYDSLYTQYQVALEREQSCANNFAINGGLINGIILGQARSAVNNIAATLANTSRYNSVPVYQDYRLNQRDLSNTCRFLAELRVVSGPSGSNLALIPVNGSEGFAFTETSDAHPLDSGGYRNSSAPSDWADQGLQLYVTNQLGALAKSFPDGYRQAVLVVVTEARKQGRLQAATELALALAMCSEKGRLIEDGNSQPWRQGDGMSEVVKQFNELCFEKTSVAPEVIWTNIAQSAMSQLGEIIAPLNTPVSEQLATANPMELRGSETLSRNLTNDFLGIASIGQNQIPSENLHVNAPLRGALAATVTVFTDLASGSGFVVSTNGYIVSNYHVVAGAARVVIGRQDGSKFAAQVVEANESRDLAVLKVADGVWSAVQLGDMDNVAIGDTVYALGSPGGAGDTVLEFTATKGIVSSIRDFPSAANPNVNVQYVQTDAAINHGNSGGPLVNEAGRVIGVNSYKIVGGSQQGLGFAISVDEVKKLFYRYLEN
jgi:S1-C subfamily serine protease